MTQARQVVAFGEVPIRDFLDPGMFGQIYVSAAVQQLFGYNLLGEVLLGALLLAVSTALTAYLALRLSGSLLLGLLAGLLTAVLFPRIYQHRVILPPLVGLLLCWRYVDCRSLPRLAWLGLATAAAFLLRHDQGVYLAAASVVTIAAVHWSAGLPFMLRRAGLYAGFSLLPLLPFLLFVQLNGGLREYFQSASEYIRSEAERGGALATPSFKIELSAPLLARRKGEPVPIRLRWTQRLAPDTRAEVERQYGLAAGKPEDGQPTSRVWRYDLLDPSDANVAALVADARVQDIGGIDRELGRVKRPSAEPTNPLWGNSSLTEIGGVLPGVLRTRNAVVWLFYLFVAIPVAALLLLVRPSATRGAELPLVLSLAAVCLIAQRALLRESLQVRLGDAAAPATILGAWLAAQLARPRPANGAARLRGPARWWRSGAGYCCRLLMLVVLLTVTLASAISVGRSAGQSAVAGLVSLAEKGPTRLVAAVNKLQTTPPAEAPDGISRPRLALARYVEACTRPSDRLLATWFAPELYFYSERAFAAGQLFWYLHYHDSPADQQAMLDRLRRQSVPIVIDLTERENSAFGFDLVASYLRERYQLAREATFSESNRDGVYRVLVDRQLTPVRTYKPLSLPCYR